MSFFTSTTTTTEILSYPSAAWPGLKLVANRYASPVPAAAGMTLLFTHCIGAHKELWEPVIAQLFKNKDTAPLIREAWSIDWQSHGDAAVVNEHLLKSRGVSALEYANGVVALLSSHHLQGHSILGIGHSAGATAILLSTLAFPQDKSPYRGIVLTEPAITTREEFEQHREGRTATLAAVFKAVDERRDMWRDRTEALQHFKKRLPFRTWDPRILQLFMRHGLRDVVARENGEIVARVALKCTKLQEKKGYDDDTEPHFAAAERLQTLNQSIQVHCIFGERSDLIPWHTNESMLQLRKMASVQFVECAGHFVLQENPDGVALSIAYILHDMSMSRGKL
ncbi:alpha/beta-hydrolase [Laetiporus sulphureus 93-53]|uniref:Alpha/beta-hydrolase n=1 Tax=Laetiporus sulphureus 93-53 TaxID=1314785 RepID=A0A165FI31_9APHY|nr:alpha/beta-hydrolase [Laetiporus sulphureus 93-53]KZT09004.1 alpha/beta-hydrolase [Laetiporus sulphureus 93-53]